MKNTKFLFVLLISVAIFACKKDNDGDNADKTIKVVIDNPAGAEHYRGVLTVSGTIDRNQKKVLVNGVDWDEQVENGEVVIYTKTFDSLATQIQFQTSAPASSLQLGYSTWSDSVSVGLTSKIDIYLDGDLVESEYYHGGEDPSADTYIKTIASN